MTTTTAFTGDSDERVRLCAPGQVEGLERCEQALEEAVQVVVRVGRDPGDHGAGGKLRNLGRERRRLAEARGRAEERERPGRQRLGEAPLQPRTRYQP
ncbi:MAG: hypothetical protein ACT4UP_03160 [Gammaproteobacteria bacterium]